MDDKTERDLEDVGMIKGPIQVSNRKRLEGSPVKWKIEGQSTITNYIAWATKNLSLMSQTEFMKSRTLKYPSINSLPYWKAWNEFEWPVWLGRRKILYDWLGCIKTWVFFITNSVYYIPTSLIRCVSDLWFRLHPNITDLHATLL